MEDFQTIILDVGSGSIKSGLDSYTTDEPTSIISSVIGRRKYKTVMPDVKLGYVGNEAMKRRAILDLNYPIRRGIVQDWDDMELLLEFIFESELKVQPSKNPIFLTDCLLNPSSNRDRMAELLFETFQTNAIYFEYQPLLSLYSSGRSCGALLHSSEGLTQIVSVSNGYVLPQSIHRLNMGGFDLTQYFKKLLNGKGLYFNSKSELEIIREMKEKCAILSLENNEENLKEMIYELPDGNLIEIGNERFEVGQALFNPHQSLGIDSVGIDKLLIDSIHNCEIDTQRDMYQNIILSGGNSRIPNFSTRIENEVEKIAPSSMKVRSVNLADSYPEWIGAAIMNSYSTQMCSLWFTSEEFEEYGTLKRVTVF